MVGQINFKFEFRYFIHTTEGERKSKSVYPTEISIQTMQCPYGILYIAFQSLTIDGSVIDHHQKIIL